MAPVGVHERRTGDTDTTAADQTESTGAPVKVVCRSGHQVTAAVVTVAAVGAASSVRLVMTGAEVWSFCVYPSLKVDAMIGTDVFMLPECGPVTDQ